MGKKIQYIGRYVMDGEILGKGNFARVELATHGVISTKVAIKVMDTRKIKEDYVRANLHREARIMAQLRHPNIIRLFETLKATTLYCLVLEYASGGDLQSFLKEQKDSRLSENHARVFIRQLLSALHYIHERGVVHRDMKMENIMLDEKRKNVKLIDFGLSNIYRKDDPLRTHCGSPEYAAPELFTPGNTYGPEIDVWSLGIIIYAMIIGRVPFRTPFKEEFQRKQLLDSIKKGLSNMHDREMQGLTTDCKNLLRQLIEPNPEVRVTMPEVILHPWVTKHGKSPFFPYQPPPKDKMMRNQAVSELGIMMGLQRKFVLEAVHENKADELSAMFNMLLMEKKKNMGWFEIDHTSRKTGKKYDRSESRERDRSAGKSPLGKGKGLAAKNKLLPNKSALARNSEGRSSDSKSIDGKTALSTQTKTKEERGAVGEDPLGPRPSIDLEGGVALPSDGEKPHTDSEDAAEGGTAKQNPAMLTTNAAAMPKKSAMANPSATAPSSSPPSKPTANGPTRIPQRRGPLNLTLDLSKPPPLSPTTKIPVPEDKEKEASLKACKAQPIRPSTLPCRAKAPSGSSRTCTKKETAKNGLEKKRSIGNAHVVAVAVKKVSPVVAPKATPEDLTLTTFSSSSSESESNLDTMQPTALLNDSQPKVLTVTRRTEPAPMPAPTFHMPGQKMVVPPATSTITTQPYPASTVPSTTHATAPAPVPSKVEPPHRGLRNYVLYKQLSESEPLEASGSAVSASSAGSGSGSRLLQARSSGGSVVTFDQTAAGGSHTSVVTFDPNAATSTMLPKGGFAVSAPGGAEAAKPSTSNPGPSRLVRTRKECRACGLSPGSPTYRERHKKFCHTGAHALDVFVSPDENPSPPGPLWRPVLMSTMSPQESPTFRHGSPGHDSPVFKFPKVGAGTPRVPMQMAMAASSSFQDEDGDADEEDEDEDEEISHHKPLLPSQRHQRTASAGDAISCLAASSSPSCSQGTSRDDSAGKQPRGKHKRYLSNAVFTQVPDTSMRLEPVGAASSDSLSGASNSSRQGDGSTEKLSSGSKARVHPMDKDKIEGEEEGMIKSKSRIPRPTNRLSKIQVFGLLQGSTEKTAKGDEADDSSQSSPSQRSGKRLLLRQFDSKNKQLTWRQGLSHLLRRSKSGTSSSTNNNVSVLRNKQSNGTTGNSVTKKPASDSREAYYQEMDARWTAPPSPTHQCNSTSSPTPMQVTSSPVPSNTPSPVPAVYDVSTSASGGPSSPHRSKHRKGGESYRLERRVSGVLKASLIPQANDSRHVARATQV